MERNDAQAAIDNLLQGVADDVYVLPRSTVARLLRILGQAEAELGQQLQRWLSTAPSGATRFTAHHYRQLILQLRTAQEGIRKRIHRTAPWAEQAGVQTLDALRLGVKEAAGMATGHIKSEVQAMYTVFGGDMGLTPLPIPQIEVITRATRILEPRLRYTARRYGANLWRDVQRQLAISMAKGDTIDGMTERLMGLGGRAATSPEHGLYLRHRPWAERIARTETINAYNVAYQEELDVLLNDPDDGDDGWMKRWDATNDMRTCMVCRPLHGKVVAVNEEFDGGLMHPPAHVNCRCALTAWHKDWGSAPSDDNTYERR